MFESPAPTGKAVFGVRQMLILAAVKTQRQEDQRRPLASKIQVSHPQYIMRVTHADNTE